MPLNPVARAAIEELRRVFHVTDLTPDEIVELNDLGAAQMAAGKRSGEYALRSPVRVGNVALHPLTCAASDFVTRWNGPEGGLSRRGRLYLIPYALAHGRDPEALSSARLGTARDVELAIADWRRGVGATAQELDDASADLLSSDTSAQARVDVLREEALDVCDWIATWSPGLGSSVRDAALARLADEREKAEADDPADASFWRRLAIKVGARTGVSPDYWYAQDRFATLTAYREALNMAGPAEGSDGDSIRALSELRKAMKRIVDARKEREEERK